MRWRCKIDAVRLVFCRWSVYAELSDSTQNSGFDVSASGMSAERFAAPVSRGFSSDGRKARRNVSRIYSPAKSASGRAPTVNAYHAGRGWRRAEYRALYRRRIWRWRKEDAESDGY